jgi:hypothetical protein
VTRITSNHHPFRQFSHAQAIGMALQLRHQVEARQRDVERGAQPAADLVLDAHGAGEHAQPQFERLVMVLCQARGQVERGLGRGRVVRGALRRGVVFGHGVLSDGEA